MMKLVPASLIIAALAGLAPPAFAQLEGPPRPGWTFLALSDDTLVYVKADPPSGAIRKVWTMYELPMPREREGVTFRSVKSLGEFDCTQGLTRTVEEAYYAQAGVEGSPHDKPPIAPTPWVKPSEGSVGEMKLEFACKPK